MYRMAVLAMCTSDESLDVSKYVCPVVICLSLTVYGVRCVMMAIVHDLGKSRFVERNVAIEL